MKLISADACAALLGISRSTFWRMRKTVPLKEYGFGSPKFEESELIAWAEECRKSANKNR